MPLYFPNAEREIGEYRNMLANVQRYKIPSIPSVIAKAVLQICMGVVTSFQFVLRISHDSKSG